MHYTVINLTRFGDLLQTACTISALKKSGSHKISLICLEQFQDAAQFIPGLDHIFPFSGAKHLKNTETGDFAHWTESYQDLRLWAKRYFEEFRTECIINLTPTVKTRLLTKFLALHNPDIREVGFCVNEFGFSHNTNVWTSYTQAVTKTRGGSPYNLIDEFRSMLNLNPARYELKQPNQEYLDAARNILRDFAAHCPEAKGFVGFQLGASNPIRQWSTENFAELAAIVWQRKKYVPVLLGTKQEQLLADEFSRKIQDSVPFFSYCGKSTLPELAAMLCGMKALVSNDTGTLHLATGLNIPVIGIYLATAQVWDTGPYGAKQICLEPNLDCHPCNFSTICQNGHACQKIISAETVYNVLCYRLNEAYSPFDGEKTSRIWEAFFQEDGFINYKPLHKENGIRTLWMQCQRIFYKNLLCRLDRRESEYPSLSFYSPETEPALAEINKLQAFVLLTKEQASLFLQMPTQKNQEKFLASTQRIKIFLEQSRFFLPLSLLFEQLLQEYSQTLDNIVRFLDILNKELILFSNFLSQK